MSKEKKRGIGKFIIGLGIGATLGVLFAPKSGKETRAELKEKLDDLMEKAKNLQAEDVKEAIQNKIKEIKTDLKNLDKETVVENVLAQARKIKAKAEDLVAYAVEKGTPVVQVAAKEVRTSTIKTLESITSKLKEKDEETPKLTTKKKK